MIYFPITAIGDTTKLGGSSKLICFEMFYNFASYKRSLVGEDAPLFTIIRSPSGTFQSLYSYTGVRRRLGLSVQDFVEK